MIKDNKEVKTKVKAKAEKIKAEEQSTPKKTAAAAIAAKKELIAKRVTPVSKKRD